AIILSQSYGFVYADHEGNSHANFQVATQSSEEIPIITIETDSSSYVEGEVITVSGSVSDFRESDPYTNFDVTIRLIAPNNNIVSISQVSLDDGFYSTSILAQGPLWKIDGDYTVSVSQGSDRNASTTFTFVHSAPEGEVTEEEVIEVSEEELAEKCGEGTHLEDGVCILDESSESETVSANTGSVPTEGFNSWIYSITFTLLIAFVIAISLFLISRVRGKKTV
ncbi:uncharacterized protein METZ01_LOCUS237599, partial [marine metagenome]